MGAEQNYRDRRALHDQPQRFHTIHARHFQVEGNDVGAQLLDFFQGEGPVHGGAHHFDGGVARQNCRDELAHQRGVVNDENFDSIAHAIASMGRAFENRDTTAGTFKISTTVPSPSMEAPLTRSLDTMSLGKALITNSSSPTNESTSRPKRFSAAPITITKRVFFVGEAGEAATACMWSKRFNRTRVRSWSRRRKISR